MDYQKAYCHLFNTMTDCIRLLQRAQQDMEELACQSPAASLLPFPIGGQGEERN